MEVVLEKLLLELFCLMDHVLVFHHDTFVIV
jgi:hypothetical protein